MALCYFDLVRLERFERSCVGRGLQKLGGDIFRMKKSEVPSRSDLLQSMGGMATLGGMDGSAPESAS
jgi:hypothetical protein